MDRPRVQKWLIGAIIGLIAAYFLLVQSGLFRPGVMVAVGHEGGATVYRSPWWSLPLLFGPPVAAMVLGAAALWLASAPLPRALAVVLGLMAAVTVVILAPLPFVHRVVVTPDGFESRIGSWRAPEVRRVRFAEMSLFRIDQDPHDPDGPAGPHHLLSCVPRDGGEPTVVPVHDLLQAALPEIARNAQGRGVRTTNLGLLTRPTGRGR